ncbi:MAG: SMP-30/gluconolactonase/LRE family protein [Aphanocapsa lilacina HA4352-LM1]|nr:SMP-30/gluconolactonase/LRE family protein [Aphanocapsa lilacina HA4352-LM1]
MHNANVQVRTLKKWFAPACAVMLAATWLLAKPTGAQTAASVLVRGGPLHGANGLAFDSKDQLHIASLRGREVVRAGSRTGAILERFGPAQGVEGPDDITFGPDGSLYWTSILTGEVGRLSPEGTKSTVAVLPSGVNPLTFSADGRLFVGLSFFGDALYELDPDGEVPPRLIASNFGGPNGFDFGPDGFLYSPIMFKGQVARIDVDTGAITPVAEGFGFPVAAKFDAQGRLYVVDLATGEVVRVDPQSGQKQVIALLPPGLDNLAFDSEDRLFVSSAVDGFVVEVLADGKIRRVIEGGLIAPGGVAVVPRPDGGESVFVADWTALREFGNLKGRQLSVERSLIGVSALSSPFTVAPDGDNLLLSSWFGNTVQIWDPAAKTITGSYSFDAPLNAIRFQGDLVVAEFGSGKVVRAKASNPDQRETLADNLGEPAGLAATTSDLWVSDRAAGSVLKIVADGQPLNPPLTVASGLEAPEGLAVEPDGKLLVVESGAGRLSRLDPKTGKATTLINNLSIGLEGIPGTPPTYVFNGVALDKRGSVYVTGDKTNVLYQFKR